MQSKKRLIIFSTGALVLLLMCSWIIYDVSASQSYTDVAPEIVLEPEITATLPNDRKNQVLMQLIHEGLQQIHYSPVEVNDAFSGEVFDLYLERLDMNKRFLMQEDVDQLKKYRLDIDDQSKAGTFELFKLSYTLITKREKELSGLYEEILDKPFDFTTNETIEFEPDNLSFSTTKKEVEDRWRKQIKYEVMTMLAAEMDIQEAAIADKDTSVTVKDMKTMEADARVKVKKRYDDYMERLKKMDAQDRLAMYINCFATRFGPHTEYFPPADKANFDIQMSGQLEGIGARLMDKDGYIKVSEVIPGGPSALQGDLDAEDKILEVAQEGEEAVNIVGAKIDDAVKIIRGKKGTKVTLTVKKIDGSTEYIEITRDVVEIEETYAKSAILNMDGKKTGLINLPKFYADFQRNGGRSCAKDVNAEITKLKAEGVDGIILDLRNNGGGSLIDAIDMAGLFIEEGPIVQVKQRRMAPEVLKDKDPTVQYDGALVVLVNRFSASASEILAAAIQDYGRGIVMGSSSTFGKGTVQQFIGLDQFVAGEFADVKPLGDLKVTLQKFYRVNGGATQLKGVIPDIVLPDAWAYVDIGEKDMEFVMPWDKIAAADIKAWKPKYNAAKIVKASEARIKSNAGFKLIDENAHRLKAQREDTEFSLNLETYRAEMKERTEEAKKYEDVNKEIEGLKITSTKADAAQIEGDEKRADRVQSWHKSLKKDPYLEEALKVIREMK